MAEVFCPIFNGIHSIQLNKFLLEPYSLLMAANTMRNGNIHLPENYGRFYSILYLMALANSKKIFMSDP